MTTLATNYPADSTEVNERAGSHRYESESGAMSQERSLLLTFLLFAVILVLSGLAAFGLATDASGTGALHSFADSMGTALTPGV